MKPEEILYNNEYTGKQEPFNNNDISRFLEDVEIRGGKYNNENVFKAVILNGDFYQSKGVLVNTNDYSLSQPEVDNLVNLELIELTKDRIVINCNLAVSRELKACVATITLSNEHIVTETGEYKGVVTISNVLRAGQTIYNGIYEEDVTYIIEDCEDIFSVLQTVGNVALSFGSYAFYALDGKWLDLSDEASDLKDKAELYKEVADLKEQVAVLKEENEELIKNQKYLLAKLNALLDE